MTAPTPKPCPFNKCGGRAELSGWVEDQGQSVCASVECELCFSRGPVSRYKVADGYHEAIVGARTDAVTAWNTVADALVDRAKNAIAKTKKGDVMAKPREGDVWKTRSGCALWQVVGGLHWCVDTDGTGPQVDDGETFYFFDDNDVIVDSNTTTKRKAKR